jgi:hypothetical protein
MCALRRAVYCIESDGAMTRIDECKTGLTAWLVNVMMRTPTKESTFFLSRVYEGFCDLPKQVAFSLVTFWYQ